MRIIEFEKGKKYQHDNMLDCHIEILEYPYHKHRTIGLKVLVHTPTLTLGQDFIHVKYGDIEKWKLWT